MATASSPAADIPEIESDEIVRCTQTIKIEAQDQQIECFAMSKDGKTCYSGALDGRVSALWMNLEKTKESFFDEGKLETGLSWMSQLELHERQGEPTRLYCAGAFEQDDSTGSSKFQGIVKMYNLRNMECEGTFFGHEGRVRSICTPGFDNTAQAPILCSGGDDGDIRLWDVMTSNCTSVIKAHGGAIQVVRGCADQVNLLVSAANTGSRNSTFDDDVGGDSRPLLWDLRQPGRPAYVLASPGACAVSSLVMSRDGTKLYGGTASLKHDNMVCEWDLRTQGSEKAVRCLGRHHRSVLDVQLACNESMLVSISKDATMACRDLRVVTSDEDEELPLVAEVRLEDEQHYFTGMASGRTEADAGMLYTVSTDVKARMWDLRQLTYGAPPPNVSRKCGNCRGNGYVEGAQCIGTEITKMRNVCWKCQGSGLAPGAVKEKEDHDFDPVERAFEMHAKAEAEKAAAAAAAAAAEGEGKAGELEAKSLEEKKDEDAATAEATPKVASWLAKNKHYKEIVRLKVGNAVMLSEEAGAEEGCLKAGEVGKVLSDDRSNMPFEVAGPRGDVSWFEAKQLMLAPKGTVYVETAQNKAKEESREEKDYKLDDEADDAAAVSFYAGGFRGGVFDAPVEADMTAEADGGKDEDEAAPPAGPAGSSGLSMYLNAARAADGEEGDASWMPTASGAGRSSQAEDQNRQKAVDDSMEMYRKQQAERRRAARGGGDEEGSGGGGWRSRRYN